MPVAFSSEDYAELLGLYLGDGHITELARTHRLRLFLDTRYPGIVDEAEELLARAFPRNRVGRHYRPDCAMVVVHLHHRHLACLFPQHGAGKKHHRRVRLEPWQERHVEAAPWAFLRGCIRSDGCAFVNRTGRYRYLSYGFANHSADILDLFEATCRGLGLKPCRYKRAIRLNRRGDVAQLKRHVGVKS